MTGVHRCGAQSLEGGVPRGRTSVQGSWLGAPRLACLMVGTGEWLEPAWGLSDTQKGRFSENNSQSRSRF